MHEGPTARPAQEDDRMSAATPPAGGSRPHGRPAAFFDLDKTIIAKSSALAFSKPFYAGGLINRRTVLRSAYAQFVFSVGGADHEQMGKMQAYLSQMVTGWDVETVREIVFDTRQKNLHPMVDGGAV